MMMEPNGLSQGSRDMNAFPPLPLLPALSLPDPSQTALLLDLDGTLLDIAPAPDQVVVPPRLCTDLRNARRQVGEALAVVTGRPIEQVDALLQNVPYAVAGEHGGAIRHSPEGDISRLPLPTTPTSWLNEAQRLEQTMAGVLLERKHRGFVLHYRATPDAREPLQQALQAMVAESEGAFMLLPALMAWELRPVGADKGTAVTALLRQSPFLGRVPIFIGDDITDEDGMRASRDHGGLGLRVQEAFGTAEAVRVWLADMNDAQ
jgi:trehalose 6-phosphate phosphatase